MPYLYWHLIGSLMTSYCLNSRVSLSFHTDLASVPSIPRTTQVFFEIQSGRVVPRLREPPRLYGVSGHMSQTVPRWPQECEVIPEEIHHIGE